MAVYSPAKKAVAAEPLLVLHCNHCWDDTRQTQRNAGKRIRDTRSRPLGRIEDNKPDAAITNNIGETGRMNGVEATVLAGKAQRPAVAVAVASAMSDVMQDVKVTPTRGSESTVECRERWVGQDVNSNVAYALNRAKHSANFVVDP